MSTTFAQPSETRICSADETLQRIRPAFETAGLTRLANLTGLDRIGLPVVAAVRPNSWTLSTSAGKGLTIAQAKVSAAMEALELFCAETVQPTFVKQSHRQMTVHYASLRTYETMLRRNVPFDEDWPRDWLIGLDLVAAESVAVPLRMVNMCPPQQAYDFSAFHTSSNGLASGNNESEAVFSGLLETIERDAITCFEHRWWGEVPPRIAIDTVESSTLRDVIERLRNAEIQVQLEDCTSDLRIPVIKARLLDEALPALGVYHGHAAHPVAEIAALKALLEAAQSRAVYIAGSRDDCFHEELQLLRQSRFTTAGVHSRSAHPDIPLPVSFCASTDLDESIASICGALQAAGLPQVVVVNVSQSAIPIHAVKVIVPGLEGYLGQHYRSARRAATSQLKRQN